MFNNIKIVLLGSECKPSFLNKLVTFLLGAVYANDRIYIYIYIYIIKTDTGADRYTNLREWFATIPDGNLPTSQKIEG